LFSPAWGRACETGKNMGIVVINSVSIIFYIDTCLFDATSSFLWSFLVLRPNPTRVCIWW
jgi:hypothetical protein